MKYIFVSLIIIVFYSCNSSRKINHSNPTPSIVLDHIYFMVPNHGKEAVKLLTETGFIVNPKVFQIKGEGMASRLILLDNVSIEILWVDDSVSYNSIELLNRLKRKTWHMGNQISPFGVAFRRAPGVGDSLPIPNRALPPEPAGSWAKKEVFSTTLRMHMILYLLFYLLFLPIWGMISLLQKEKKKHRGFLHIQMV
jgi:hypothetical protein